MLRAIVTCVSFILALWSAPGRGEDITWVTSAQRGEQTSETPDAGQMDYLIGHLPKFTHHKISVSTARAYYELQHGPGVCKVGVLVSPERLAYAAFTSRRLVQPGFRLLVRKDRQPAFSKLLDAKGKIDLDKLSAAPLTGAYTRSRHYGDAIDGFIERRGAGIDNVVATFQLFNLMQAGRLDYAFVMPTDLYFYSDEAARRTLALLPIKGVAPTAEAGVACTPDASGRAVIAAVDTLLADESNWAAFVEPMRKWVPPADYPMLLGRSNVDRVP